MDYLHLVPFVIGDTKDALRLFLPELVVCVTILLMLTLRVSDLLSRIPTWLVALGGTTVALGFGLPWHYLSMPAGIQRHEIFTGMLVYDNFTIFFRGLLLLFGVLFILFTRVSGVPNREDAADFYTLSLGATLGMMLMASANHLLIIFLAVEMASVPSYVLSGMLKGRRRSSEASLKYSVYGAGAAGVMLYGISLLAGALGSCHLPTMALRLATMFPAAATPSVADPNSMVLVLGGLMLMVGLAFKLSAVPFHFWCPDVFEGASAEVNAFLSVASKAAALALLVRVVIGFGTLPDQSQPSVARATPAVAGAEPIVDLEPHVDAAPVLDAQRAIAANVAPTHARSSKTGQSIQFMAGEHPAAAQPTDTLAPARKFMMYVVALIAAITCTFGNLAAYGQTNIKRLLAYSTIAHAGYMMMPIAAGLALMNTGRPGADQAFASLLIYIGIYLFMNLGAFAVVAFLRNRMRSEEIADYAGLMRGSPGLTVCFCIILFSLIGIPPMAGFLGKFAIFSALAVANTAPMIALLVIGGLNTAVALVYYLRVIKLMTIDPPPKDRSPVEFSLVSIPGAYLVAITLPLVILIFDWNVLSAWAQSACRQLIR